MMVNSRIHETALAIHEHNITKKDQDGITEVVFRDRDAYFLLNDYANLFLNTVNWSELAEVYNTDILTQKLNINGE
jgi:hypothetical protein